ncbi:MAG TPA: uracil-DNA glycosylase [Gaiellaceae bacterium]
MRWSSFAAALAGTRIGTTFNQYASSRELQSRLADYLERRAGAELLFVGEAAGYRGARVSGIPFTSERQLTGGDPAEASATIVHRVLDELGLEEHVLLWNVVPTHPHRPGEPDSNRRPRAAEIEASLPFLETLSTGRVVVPVGRVAEATIGTTGIRHPAHGGASEFRAGLARLV